jgi:hypothetical protein
MKFNYRGAAAQNEDLEQDREENLKKMFFCFLIQYCCVERKMF